MGKASRLKKEKKIQVEKPQMISPELIEAYVRGRKIGVVDGFSEAMTNYHTWTDEIDKHVKGIGPGIKALIEEYFANRIRESINKNTHKK